MPSYIVQGTHIWHGAKGAKQAVLYGPGEAIELTPAGAVALGSSVKAAGGPGATQAGAASGDEPKAEPEATEPPAAGVGGQAPRRPKGPGK